jgi:hypothetical protein
MKVDWWWLLVVAAIAWWWSRQREQLAAFKSTPGYKAAVAAGTDPLNPTNVKTVPPGASVSVTNPPGSSAFQAD